MWGEKKRPNAHIVGSTHYAAFFSIMGALDCFHRPLLVAESDPSAIAQAKRFARLVGHRFRKFRTPMSRRSHRKVPDNIAATAPKSGKLAAFSKGHDRCIGVDSEEAISTGCVS